MPLGVFVGTRPEVIKLAPVLQLLDSANLPNLLVHTGQHYDWAMSAKFFNELSLRKPNSYLETVPSDASIVHILSGRISAYLRKHALNAIMVLGDTNTALAASLVGCTNVIPVIHVEAGCRSHDRLMPEEINRIIIADCAELNFAATSSCVANLRNENVPGEIILSGHPIVDLLNGLRTAVKNRMPPVDASEYVYLTLHRPENVDDPARLARILTAVGKAGLPVVFPVHPRTKKNLDRFGLESTIPSNIIRTEPIGYVDSLALISHALFVATDSGGIQQESFLLRTPCLTIRRSFEWIETFEAGVNFLANPERDGFEEAVQSMMLIANHVRARFRNAPPIFGENGVASRITKAVSTRYRLVE